MSVDKLWKNGCQRGHDSAQDAEEKGAVLEGGTTVWNAKGTG